MIAVILVNQVVWPRQCHPQLFFTNSPAEPFSEIPTRTIQRRHAACIAINLKAHSRLHSRIILAREPLAKLGVGEAGSALCM